jgi:ElaB/YqjD/DUF883 family membrane-anchored ribosome-binding protein
VCDKLITPGAALAPAGVEWAATTMSEKPPRFQMEQSVAEELDAFVETISEKLESCGMPEEDRAEIEEAGESAVEAVEARLDNIEKHVQIQFKEIVENEERIDDLQETADEPDHGHAQESVPDAVSDLVPMEVVSYLDVDKLLDNQRSRETIERATTLFENMQDWGDKTPKGRTLRLADHNVKSLLEAELDTSLKWKQVHRACRFIEAFTKGACTFFNSDRHGRVLCLHDHSDLYERLENGSNSLTSSSAQTRGGMSASG